MNQFKLKLNKLNYKLFSTLTKRAVCQHCNKEFAYFSNDIQIDTIDEENHIVHWTIECPNCGKKTEVRTTNYMKLFQ